VPYATRAQPARGNCGFTLIELLIVMTIITIAFFALRPGFAPVEGARERAAVRQLVGMFTAAHAEAVARGQLVRVVFEPDQRAFFPEIQFAPEVDRAAFDPLPLLGKRAVRMPEHLGMASLEVRGSEHRDLARTDIYFYPDGRTDGVVMVLDGGRGRDVRVAVSPATGRVRIDD
jgi:prepilin-type N-terminal cleavage/methylation domain-containing protein